ncbi:ribonuclease H-like domain-containing protein [Tanacetum coccineum]
MTAAVMKHMASNFTKLDKFEGVEFRRWQKKMHFLLSSMSVVYMLTTSIPKDGLILNDMFDPLFDIYQNVESSKELWDSLEANHLCIEESLRIQDNDKPKGNNVVGPSVVNIVEHNNSSRYTDNKGKRKHQDTKVDPNKKSKVTCWKCGKPGHLKKDYNRRKVGNMAFLPLRDVKFFENIFPFKEFEVEKNDSANVFQDVNHINFFDIEYPEIANDDERVANDLNKDKSDSSSSSVSCSNINTVDFPVDSGNDADSNDGRSSRQSVFPRNYNDFFVESKVKYGIERYVGYSKLNSENHCSITQLNKTREPKSYFEASKYHHWTNAMNQEIDALLRNGSWEMVQLPKGRKAIGIKWIYKIKFRSSGEIDGYKARLVAQGFGQNEGINYEEKFSPVVKMVTVRSL